MRNGNWYTENLELYKIRFSDKIIHIGAGAFEKEPCEGPS